MQTQEIHSALPQITGPLPGPNAKRIIERDSRVLLAFLHAQLSARRGARRGRHRHGRRWQSLSRLQRRHRRGRHRPLPSARRRGHSEAGRAADPHVGHRLLLRRHGGRWPRSWPRSPQEAWPRRVYFGNSGAEAIEAAIKLARYHTGRDNSSPSSAASMAAPWARSRSPRARPCSARIRAAGSGVDHAPLSELLSLPLRQDAGYAAPSSAPGSSKISC